MDIISCCSFCIGRGYPGLAHVIPIVIESNHTFLYMEDVRAS